MSEERPVSESALRARSGGDAVAVPRPQARAGNAKDFLSFLEEFQPGATAHLRATLPHEVMETVEHSARTEWTPIELDAQYVDEIVRWLGQERACDAWRRFMTERFIRAPAIGALAEGAIRLFGLSVHSFVRMIPFAFRQGFREFAEVEVQLHGDHATVTIRRIAPGVTASYATLFRGLFLGIYDLVGREPQLEFQHDAGARRIVAQFRW
jgi:hypothetical protein